MNKTKKISVDLTEKGKPPAAAEKLETRLAAADCRVRIVPAKYVDELRFDVEKHWQSGDMDEEFYRDRLTHFKYSSKGRAKDFRSIIIIAVPQPHVFLTFTWQGKSVPIAVPPTYSVKIDDKIRKLLRGVLSPAGYQFFRCSLPLKTLAVHSGLAKYGKNNLVFVKGMGSYCRLMAFGTDMPPDTSFWGEPEVMDQCKNCSACRKKCPTGAIPDDRFLLRAEKCMTFLDEREADFPEWFDATLIHCIFGCLQCQTFCPVNRKLEPFIKAGPVFDAVETELLLNASPTDTLPKETRLKIKEFGDFGGPVELARNLRILLENPESAKLGIKLFPRQSGKGKSHDQI